MDSSLMLSECDSLIRKLETITEIWISRIFQLRSKRHCYLNISASFVIVLDNASYHNKLINKIPSLSSHKAYIKKWLRNDISYNEDLIKAELLMLVKIANIKKAYGLVRISTSAGHTIIRLLP